MAKNLTPDRQRAGIALVAVAIVVFIGNSFGQIGAIGLGAVAGLSGSAEVKSPRCRVI